MLRIEHIYWLVGAFLLVAAFHNLRARRWSSGAFWAILALPFLAGDAVLAASARDVAWPAQAMGVGVIALGVLAARGGHRLVADDIAAVQARREHSRRLGNRLFLPALAIPLLTLALVLGGKWLHMAGVPLIDPAHLTLVSLGLACVGALALALTTTRSGVPLALGEGSRLLDALGWAALLPMLLATLGSVFAATGVGGAIAHLVGAVFPVESPLACLVAFALGMVLFTVVMGNAFAAFPVMMAGIGMPLLIGRHGADPASLGALGMLTGYCGTLLTPMAANFNIVPAVLLELPDQYGVIRAQVATALALLAFNVVLMWFVVFG